MSRAQTITQMLEAVLSKEDKQRLKSKIPGYPSKNKTADALLWQYTENTGDNGYDGHDREEYPTFDEFYTGQLKSTHDYTESFESMGGAEWNSANNAASSYMGSVRDVLTKKFNKKASKKFRDEFFDHWNRFA